MEIKSRAKGNIANLNKSILSSSTPPYAQEALKKSDDGM